MSSIFTCPDLIAFHLSHVFTSGILHDYLLNGYRIPSQGENVSINQWHINSRCTFYVGYISPVKVFILNYLVILSRKHTWKLFLLMLYCSYVNVLLIPLELQLYDEGFSYIVIYLYMKIKSIVLFLLVYLLFLLVGLFHF